MAALLKFVNTETTKIVPTLTEIVNCKSVNSKSYDLSGRQVNGNMKRGIYIHQGRKIVIK